MSKIYVNGKLQELKNPASVLDIIKNNNVLQPDMVSVQLNGEFVLREDYESTQIKDGDEVNFLYFMGGGSDLFYKSEITINSLNSIILPWI
ncbi:MAG: sulfur carrier protein ThiS [Bacteroidales bacterium]